MCYIAQNVNNESVASFHEGKAELLSSLQQGRIHGKKDWGEETNKVFAVIN